MAGYAGAACPPTEDEKMSQGTLFGVESYRDTRKTPKGRAVSKIQMQLFALVEKAAAVVASVIKPKRGQRYLVALTGLAVTFLRQIGSASLWECDGITWRATAAQIEAAGLRLIS